MNKRNHPYFNPIVEEKKPINQQNVVACNNVQPVEYEPRMAQPWSPKWIDNQNYVKALGEAMKHSAYLPEHGYCIDNKGYIWDPTSENEARAGVIAGIAIASDVNDPNMVITGRTHIINTEDCGLRHVHMNEHGFAVDLGPVENTCIIGNIDRPEGVYVPMCNTRAIADGIVFLNKVMEESIENNADLVDTKAKALPSAPFEDEHHECACACGGKCKCKNKK